VRVVEEIQRRFQFPDHVQVLDGGTLGMDLLRFVNSTQKLLVVDAIAGGGSPGTYYQFSGDQVKAYLHEKLSVHEMGIKDVLAAMELLDRPIEEVVVLGVQPAVMELGLDLSPLVGATVESTIQAVVNQLAVWQVEVMPHG
jgi:hydrogenase maturation protease